MTANQGHLGQETGLLLTRFRFHNFSISDERGSVINDYLQYPGYKEDTINLNSHQGVNLILKSQVGMSNR